MTHPATARAARLFIEALGAPIDLGLVFPPRDGEQRGRGVWYAHAVKRAPDLANLLDRAAAANVAGAAVYARVHGAGVEHAPHAGVVLVDDLDADGVRKLEVDRLSPSVVVETSPANFQAWVRLAADGQMSRHDAIAAARELATRYGGDPRAVAAYQPGRLPGFTNRKPKHQRSNGMYPFVRLRDARPGLIGPGAVALLRHIRDASAPVAQPGRARGAPETPLAASDGADWPTLDAVRLAQKARIDAEVASGRRAVASGTASEIDFAAAVQALRDGVQPGAIEAWLRGRRPDHHVSYAARTAANAARYLANHTDVSHHSPATRLA